MKRSNRPDQWGEDEHLFLLGQKNWPWAQRRLTAATVIDLTSMNGIGKYVMFFHGSSEEGAKPHYNAHNNASLGIAWSDDLVDLGVAWESELISPFMTCKFDLDITSHTAIPTKLKHTIPRACKT